MRQKDRERERGSKNRERDRKTETRHRKRENKKREKREKVVGVSKRSLQPPLSYETNKVIRVTDLRGRL